MQKLHHATVKGAVATYKHLVEEGKTEAEIRAALATDAKAYTAEGIDQIYAALIGEPAPSEQPKEGNNIGDSNKGAENGAAESEEKPKGTDKTPPAPKQKPSTDSKPLKYLVVKPFRDIDDFNHEHEVGTDVSHFDMARLESLVEKGLVEAK